MFGWFKKTPEAPARRSKPARRVRAYAAAQGGRLFGSWLGSRNSADTEIYSALETLRARGRDLAQNNGYARRFLSMCKTNIVGHTGVRLQNKAYLVDGKNLDKNANTIIEERFKKFCRVENCCTSGDLSMIDLEKMIVESVMRDGEILVRKVKGFPHNGFRYALQPIEADQLDHTINCTLANGNRVVMGVEKDRWGRRVAYHILSNHPGEVLSPGYHRKTLERIPAGEILHLFIPERVNQSRGVSWLAPSAARAKMLDAYEEAEVIAARVSASKMGIFTRPEGSEDDDLTDEELEESEGSAGSADVNIEVEPGTFETGPEGYDLKMFDPTHPNSAFAEFMKGGLRGIASGWDCSYVMLANNLEGVNLSSIRHGEVAERDKWRILQTWLIEHFCCPVHEDWLLWDLLTGGNGLEPADFERLNAPCWRPRGWQFVDIDKESKAVNRDVGNHTRNIWDVAAQRGDDLEEIFEGNARALQLAQEYGLKLHIFDGEEEKQNETDAGTAGQDQE